MQGMRPKVFTHHKLVCARIILFLFLALIVMEITLETSQIVQGQGNTLRNDGKYIEWDVLSQLKKERYKYLS